MLCLEPLDDWLPKDNNMQSGLWMYHGNGGRFTPGAGPASWSQQLTKKLPSFGLALISVAKRFDMDSPWSCYDALLKQVHHLAAWWVYDPALEGSMRRLLARARRVKVFTACS